ncbi:MAG: DNA adenine methylase [Bacteroidota bacterium]
METTTTKKNKQLKPFVKWAGGKRQLLAQISPFIPATFGTYYEPFLGGGAVLFHIQPQRCMINDINTEMINVYRMVQNRVEELIQILKTYKNESDFYYAIRSLDRSPNYDSMSAVERAARILFLNKTCFNGLFRVNRQGQFNVPFGRYKNPNITNEDTLRAVSAFLQQSNCQLLNTDFAKAVQTATAGDFIYFDPPYDPLPGSPSFTDYTLSGFGQQDQERLKQTCDSLHKRGVKFLLSNSATNFIKELYGAYTVQIVRASRNINSVGKKRGKIDEVLIRNYP